MGINGTISDVASLDDHFYISTLSGIYCMQKKKGSEEFTVDNFKEVDGKFEQSWGFLYFIKPEINFENTYSKLNNPKKYFHPSSEHLKLLTSTSTGIHEITENRSRQISGYRGIFDLYQYIKDPTKLFLSLSTGIAILDYNNGEWTDLGMPFGITDKIKQITEDNDGNLWANAIYKGIYKIENPLSNDFKITFFDTEDGLPSENIVSISEYNNKLLFSTYTEDYEYIAETDSFSLFIFQEENGDSSIQDVDTLCWYKFSNTRISPWYVTTYADSMRWFGTSTGVFRYSAKLLKDYYHLKPPLVRKVLSGDSLIFGGTNYLKTEQANDSIFKNQIITDQIIDLGNILDFKDNSLTFHYTLPYYNEEDQNEYSFFLEGNDETWSPWTKETKKEYTNLREGDYIFKVKAKTQYQIESPVTEFRFTILAPWYRTFAAVLGYIILGIILIIVIVRLYTYRLIKEKDKLEKIVIERTQEILMQKEEILVQAEHLKDANERISAKNEELEKQKWEITNQALKLKKANVELIKLSKVASETDNAIAIFDKDGNMEWVNDGFTRLYGYTFDEYSKEKNINLLEGSDNPNIQEAIKSCLKNKQSIVYEFKTTNKQGEEIWAQTTLTHVVDKDDQTINLIAIDSDITKLKQAEKEILKQKEEIEKHRDELAKSNATKDKFFRIIAHDLRNPISTLAGSTNLIFNDFDEYNKEQTKNFIGELNRLSQTTFNLLENLLDWSSSQMGEIKYDPKSIHIGSLTQENIELIKQKVDSKNISLINHINDHCEAFADENMVKTIIRNLLSNAVKFTPNNGEINIRCSVDGEFLKYSVKDSGIGINKEDLKKLFKIETHHTTPGLANEKGSGLGLILCKEFVERNGGTIQINSEPNKGTTIEFTLKRHSS
jgi:PAS domain S-box-containing protein